MTITLSTDPIVAVASIAYHAPIFLAKAKMETRRQKKYNRMIVKSQKKLAETKLVPGYTKIYA